MGRQNPHSPELVGSKVVSAVDWLGNRFAVGDTVIYCIGAGRGQMMAIGEVVQIKTEQKFHTEYPACEPDHPDAEYYDNNLRGERFHYRQIRRPYDEITVQVRTLKTSGQWDNKERSKPAWVNPMNITALKPVGTT